MSDSVAIFIAGVITAILSVVSLFFWRKSQTPVVPTPPGPSPTEEKENARLAEALERARKAKEEAEKLAGAEREQATTKMHQTILEDISKLQDDPEALNQYLAQVGKDIRGG